MPDEIAGGSQLCVDTIRVFLPDTERQYLDLGWTSQPPEL